MPRRRITKTPPAAAGINGAPAEIREWFEGRRPMPITALCEPYINQMPAAWADFARRNPGARPPSDAPPSLAPLMFGQ